MHPPGLASTSSTCSPYRANRQSPHSWPCRQGGGQGSRAGQGFRAGRDGLGAQQRQSSKASSMQLPTCLGGSMARRQRSPGPTCSESSWCAGPASSGGTGGTTCRCRGRRCCRVCGKKAEQGDAQAKFAGIALQQPGTCPTSHKELIQTAIHASFTTTQSPSLTARRWQGRSHR